MSREAPGAVLVAEGIGLSRYAELAAGTFAQFSGRVLQTSPESISGSFDHPEPAVRAAREFLRRAGREAVTIGIDPAAAEAAALARRGRPGQILVSRAVSDLLVLVQDLHCTWVQEDLFRVVTEETAPGPPALILDPGATRDSGSQPGFVVTSSDYSPSAPVEAALSTRYEILGEAGRGGMGIVYKVRDRETGETLAVKVIKAEILADPVVLQRFKNEILLAHRITHRNICRIHDFNRAGDVAYITMEYVEGESLREILKGGGAREPQKGVAVARQICTALREAHREGVVHRDLKPENVMLDRSGTVKVMDFGVARSLEAGATALTTHIVGTPAYMAPEQAEGKAVDQRTDIYALGLILYEMFTGVQAIRGQTMAEVILKQIREIPARPSSLVPSLPASLEAVILRCMEKDPAHRFQSADECESALAGESAAESAAAAVTPAPRPWPSTPKWPGTRVMWVGLALSGLLAAGGITYIAMIRNPAEGPGRSKDLPPPAPASRAPSVQQEQPPKPAPPAADPVKARIRDEMAQAAKAMEQGRYDEAIRLFQSVLNIDPNHSRAKEGLRRARSAKAAEAEFLKKR